MSWDAYNRRNVALREVLAQADRRRENTTVTQLMHEVDSARDAFDDEAQLLLDLQMKWFQKLSGHLDRSLTFGAEDLEAVVVGAWAEAAAQSPGMRVLLDQNEDRSELRKAQKKEAELLARSAGLHGADGIVQGERIKERARESVVQVPPVPDTPAGLFARIREAIAA